MWMGLSGAPTYSLLEGLIVRDARDGVAEESGTRAGSVQQHVLGVCCERSKDDFKTWESTR